MIAADLERTTLISKLDSNNLVTNDTNELDEIDKANLEEHVRSVLTLEKVNGFTKIK